MSKVLSRANPLYFLGRKNHRLQKAAKAQYENTIHLLCNDLSYTAGAGSALSSLKLMHRTTNALKITHTRSFCFAKP
jgi:hypothetical protein